jgi:hypothetical protein
MKKKMLFAAITIIGMIAVFNINAVEKTHGDISLQNIEMLSSGESGQGINCSYIGSLDCPVSGAKVFVIW